MPSHPYTLTALHAYSLTYLYLHTLTAVHPYTLTPPHPYTLTHTLTLLRPFCIPSHSFFTTTTTHPLYRQHVIHGIPQRPDNKIGAAGARELAGALKDLTGLKKLDLYSTLVLG